MNVELLRERIDALGLAHLSDRILETVRPCVMLDTAPASGLPVGATKIGGAPDLAPSIQWPTWRKIGGSPGWPRSVPRPVGQEEPLSFLAQLNCSDFRGTEIAGELPETGLISFFYDAEQSTWGYDPEHKGSWTVLFTNSITPDLERRELPHGIPDYARYRECSVTPREAISIPGWQTPHTKSLKLSERDSDLYCSLLDDMSERGTRHQVLGYAEQLQAVDMQLECQLVTHGLYCGGAGGYLDPQTQELERGSADWRLLFQLDTDEENPGMTWGTSGRLYFWIKSADLRQRRFDSTWLHVQCT
jgi:uncharacterized protein YwqG